MKITWTSAVLETLVEAVEYMALDNPLVATKWLKALLSRIEILCIFPKLGRRVPNTIKPNIRQIIFGSYKIVYRASKENIDILAVRHVKRKVITDKFVRARDITVDEPPPTGLIF